MTYTPSNPCPEVVSKINALAANKLSDLPPPPKVDCLHYVHDGELKLWEGETVDVLSCVCVNDSGADERVNLGRIHYIDTATAIQLVDSAYKAFDLGRGKWPHATVAERLAATENFLSEMVKVREEVVVSLMWEIGKTRKDSESEFDRTVEYIQETLKAVRTRNNTDASFLTAGGHVAQVRRSPLGVVLSMGPFN